MESLAAIVFVGFTIFVTYKVRGEMLKKDFKNSIVSVLSKYPNLDPHVKKELLDIKSSLQ